MQQYLNEDEMIHNIEELLKKGEPSAIREQEGVVEIIPNQSLPDAPLLMEDRQRVNIVSNKNSFFAGV